LEEPLVSLILGQREAEIIIIRIRIIIITPIIGKGEVSKIGT